MDRNNYYHSFYFDSKFYTRILIRLISLVMIIRTIQAFNIDVKTVHTWKGPDNSHFGYTLGFDRSDLNQENISFYVGAPKEVTSVRGQKLKTGNVHVCNFGINGLDCTGTTYKFPEFASDPKTAAAEGFGSSLSISKYGTILECAPFWKDTAFVNDSHMFMPGRCTLNKKTGIAQTLAPYFHTKREAKLYLDGKEYYHGFATFGFATDTIHVGQKSTFVFGSPGLTIFEGAIYIRDSKDWTVSSSTDKAFKNTLQTRTAYGYLGYEVKLGTFCDRDVCLAAGAPNLYTYGMVKMYQWINQAVLYNFQDLQGDQPWSYFGSVLCAVNADNAALDELLVGAPYYSDKNNNKFDIGRVYVYGRDDKSKKYEIQLTLGGSESAFSRFGSSIQSIGDINLDGYPDIAIGAPGEEDGTGCIYIHIGGKAGLSSKHSQKICGDDVPGQKGKLNGFGSTISSSAMLSKNPYTNFAVSSYLTDTVLMFNTRLIVRTNAEIDGDPNPLDLTKRCDYDSAMEPCILFNICFSQKIQGLPTRKLNFLAHFELDTQRRAGNQQRVQIVEPSGELVDSLDNVPLKEISNRNLCRKYMVVTKKSQITKDRFTPIEIKVTMELDKGDPVSGIDPILDPTVPNTFSHMVSLANDCGFDNVCKVDLKVQGSVSYANQDQWPFVVIGHTKELQVDLTISNSHETSYGTRITVKISQPLQYLRPISDTVKQCKVDLSTDTANSNTVVVCNYYHPLKKSSSLKLSIVFDAMNVALDKRNIKVTATAMPTDYLNSPEKNPADNEIDITTPVYIVADVNVHGSSSPTEVTIKDAKGLSLTIQETISGNFTPMVKGFDPFTLNHKFQMKNLGPSFLPKTNMYLSIPAYLPDASQLLAEVSVQLKLGDNDAISCTDIVTDFEEQGTIYPTRPTDSKATKGVTDSSVPSLTTRNGDEKTTAWSPGGSVNKRRRRAADKDLSKTYFLTCQTSPEYCVHFKCDLQRNIISGGHVQLNVTFSIDKRNIPVPTGFTSFYLQLTAFVSEPQHLLFKPWNITSKQEATTRTSTIFHKVDSGERINIWIIIGSVIAGLVLILIIGLIFWKLGFFKRNKHQEVNEWKRKSQRLSRPPRVPGNEQKGDDI